MMGTKIAGFQGTQLVNRCAIGDAPDIGAAFRVVLFITDGDLLKRLPSRIGDGYDHALRCDRYRAFCAGAQLRPAVAGIGFRQSEGLGAAFQHQGAAMGRQPAEFKHESVRSPIRHHSPLLHIAFAAVFHQEGCDIHHFPIGAILPKGAVIAGKAEDLQGRSLHIPGRRNGRALLRRDASHPQKPQ